MQGLFSLVSLNWTAGCNFEHRSALWLRNKKKVCEMEGVCEIM